MLCMGSNDKPEKYGEYKNRTFTRHEKRTKDTVTQILSCSLNDGHKKALLLKLKNLLDEEAAKIK
jgi:hypothetical protein